MADFDGFEFIITEENDVMLIIYARAGNPEKPVVKLDLEHNSIVLYRNQKDVVTIENVEKEVLDILSKENLLLITEVVPTKNPLEQEFSQAYGARIIH